MNEPPSPSTPSSRSSFSTSAKNAWQELVVTPKSPYETTPSPSSPSASEPQPDFELSVSKTRTPHSILLPQLSPRYAPLLATPGSTIEISPESLDIASNIATRIGGTPEPQAQPSGAALILDYGPSATIPANSLRGIRSHQRVSPFALPGHVDVSADVDFRGLAEAAIGASSGVEVHGPVEQGVWLRAMGIEARAEVLSGAAKGDEEKRRIEGAWRRLVDMGPNGMGKMYKAMAIVPWRGEGKSVRRPVGFGGDVKV